MEWMAKLLNVSMMLGSLELFVLIDEYKQKKSEGNASELNLQAYARINPKKTLERLLRSKEGGQLLSEAQAQEEEIYAYIQSQVLFF